MACWRPRRCSTSPDASASRAAGPDAPPGRCPAQGALKLWTEAEQDRKKAWKLFLHFGPWLAFRALTRTIGLGDALRIAGKRLGLVAKLVPLEEAEAAIDVDKPSDHSLAERILSGR